MRKKKMVIIGNGMATSRLLDELDARGADARYAITVFGDEPGGAYNRILLSKVLAGEQADSIAIKPPSWYSDRGIRLASGETVVRLDTAERTVVTESGTTEPYDLAILATGSKPVVPPLPGMTLSS